ncbi:inositol polyphosphate multikinase-like [Saccoglossus kowalevskii]
MDVIPTFIKKLEEIQNWFENQTKMHFFSSSLLLVYEGDVQISSDEENEFVQLNPNIVSFAELEMTNSDAKQSNSDKDYLSFPPPSLLHKDKAGEHVSMATAPNNVGDKVDDQKSLVNGLDGPKASLQEDATVEQSFTETLHIKESDDDDDEVIGALTVAEMRARQKKKLAPPSTVTPLASLSQDPDWSSRDTCDLKPPIAEAGLPMQACASEPINLVTSTIDDRLADVKMIDFTHVIPSNSVDENYLYGLRRLIQHFKTLNVCGFEY